MGKGNSKTQVNDWINSFDPRVGGLAGKKGSIFRYIPTLGLPEILVKQDEGFSVNWTPLQPTVPENPALFYVNVDGEYPTIQSAIDAAYAAGSGDGTFKATIYIPPGNYIENLTFRPGQSLIAQAANVSLNAVTIQGQHTFTSIPGGNIIDKAVLLQGLTFNDSDDGNTILIDGVNDGFFSMSGCSFAKFSAIGRCILCTNSTMIVTITSTSVLTMLNTDPVIESNSNFLVMQQNVHNSNSGAPFALYTGAGTFNHFYNQALTMAPYVVSCQSGQSFCGFNFYGSFAPNSDCIRCDALAYVFNSTLLSSVGTGYVLQGSGTINGGMIVYGVSAAKDPSLTFNLLPSDPS